MSIAIITGSAGLIGSEATQFLCDKGYDVVGIDNDMRGKFFGADASTTWHRKELEELKRYSHANIDIRNEAAIHDIFKHFGRDASLIIHAAAQPSHDWAADNPVENFDINTKAT